MNPLNCEGLSEQDIHRALEQAQRGVERQWPSHPPILLLLGDDGEAQNNWGSHNVDTCKCSNKNSDPEIHLASLCSCSFIEKLLMSLVIYLSLYLASQPASICYLSLFLSCPIARQMADGVENLTEGTETRKKSNKG